MAGELDEAHDIRLSPAQLALLAELVRPNGARSVYLDTGRGRFSVTLEDLPVADAKPPAAQGETVRANSVGEFLTGYPSRGAPLVRQGARVAPGDLLGLVRTGLVFAPVILPADDPRPATLTRILAPAGTLVGYGTPLFELHRH